MPPHLRKLALAAHITFSVGWLGAVVAYLALAVAGLIGRDAENARAMYLSMEVIGWFVILPFGVAALLIGLVESLGTSWGLFRHWWIVAKFVLTTGATLVLVRHLSAITRMSRLAREVSLSVTDFRQLRTQLVVHAAGALLVLLTATMMSVYKPWGMTPYGLRQRRDWGPRSPLDRGASVESSFARISLAPSTPRWRSVARIHALHVVGLAVLFLVVHFASGGMRSH